MILTGKKNEVVEILNNKLASIYKTREINSELFCENKKGDIFIVRPFPSEEAIVVEYADNYEDALSNLFEDGDRFYLEDYETYDELSDAVVMEIEN